MNTPSCYTCLLRETRSSESEFRDTKMESLNVESLIVPLKQIDYGVYGDLILIYPKPYSIYLRGTIAPKL